MKRMTVWMDLTVPDNCTVPDMSSFVADLLIPDPDVTVTRFSVEETSDDD